MNVTDILSRVKRQFGDESGVQITDADIFRWINDAQRDIAMAHGILQARALADTLNGQAEYGMPDNILQLHSVRFKGFVLKELSVQEVGQSGINTDTTHDATPRFYSMFARTLTLYPAPDRSEVGVLEMLYTKQPDEIVSASDPLSLPSQYHNAVVDDCLRQAYELDENAQMAQLKSQQYQQGMTELRGRADQQPEEYYPFITYSEDTWTQNQGWGY